MYHPTARALTAQEACRAVQEMQQAGDRLAHRLQQQPSAQVTGTTFEGLLHTQVGTRRTAAAGTLPAVTCGPLDWRLSSGLHTVNCATIHALQPGPFVFGFGFFFFFFFFFSVFFGAFTTLRAQDHPAVDLLIRTSGETRLSDFLLWQSATAQLAFVPALWPDFSYLDFLGAVVDYQLGYPAMQVSSRGTTQRCS